nr:hypothetical protein [Tanacetum cinerariifolium]
MEAGGSKDKNKKGRSKEKGMEMVNDGPVVNDDGNSNSYANVTSKPSRMSVNFHTLFTPEGNEIDAVVPVESIRAISERFVNIACGFFLRKRVACPAVANYLRNTWEDIGTVPVWVKLHRVPVMAFNEDGLCAISTKLGTPLMLDSYTSDMCMQSWSTSSYAKAMIELRADVELKDNIVADMPKITKEGYYTCNIRVEYEWNLLDVHVKAIERLKQGESINVQDLETNLYWEFGKFTSRDGESLELYYSRSQQAATRKRGKVIINSLPLIYDQEPSMVAEDDEMSKDKEIDKFMDLISLSFKKIFKPTNKNFRTSSNTSRANQDNSLRISKGTGYDNQRIARECQKLKRVKDAAYHKEKMLLCKQEEAGFQLNAEQADWSDDTDDEHDDQEAHYVYMAQIQEITPDAANNFGPIFDTVPLQKVPNNDNYNMFAIECEHPEQSKSVNDTYLIIQDEHNVIIDSLDMSYDREQIDRNDDDDDDLANECDLLASLIKKLKCEIDDRKNRNKFLETSNKVLVDKLKSQIEDFKTKNRSLESSNNHFKEANNELSKTNELMCKDLKKFQAELDRYNDVKYASKVEIDCAKAKGDLLSYKMEFEKSSNVYTQKINDLNQMILDMKKELFAHQETISILSQAKEAQLKFYKTRLIPPTSVSRTQLKSNQMEDRVMLNNSQGKKQEVEDHRRNVKLSKNKTSVTTCNDSLNAKTSNVNFVCATCGKCVLNEKHDMYVLKSHNGVNSRTKMPMAMPISTREPKRIVKQSVAKPLRKTVAS